MDRGAWRATVHRFAELDTTEQLTLGGSPARSRDPVASTGPDLTHTPWRTDPAKSWGLKADPMSQGKDVDCLEQDGWPRTV